MKTTLAAALLAVVAFSPLSASAAEVSGWIPYWTVSKGTKDAQKHLDVIDTLHPFSFSVSTDGSLKDLAGMEKSAYKKLLREAEKEGVEVIPTIMWSATQDIHRILSNSRLRDNHIEEIVEMVEDGGYDGVDIDYEGKLATTKPFFSTFLKELKAELPRGAVLSCTIEARTPPDSLYTTVPATIEYANDFKEINRYCDRVNIMTYDQQRADLKLNATRKGMPYYPVADIDWVKKVVALTTKDIDKRKISLGVATYGREVQVQVAPEWFKTYTQLWSVSDDYARDTAKKYKVTPWRNGGGELSYSYIEDKKVAREVAKMEISKADERKDKIAAQALAYANKTGKTITINMVSWSDAKAIADKVALADALGLKGIAIFKIDGGEDMDLWDDL